MTPRSKIPPPNYTQAPNVLLDELLPDIGTLAELKVTLVIVRQTIGWHQDEQELSLAELEERTGLSRPSAIAGVKAGIERGTIERRIEGPKGAEQSFYTLNLASEASLPALVKDLDQPQSSILTSPGEASSPPHIEERNGKEKTPDPLTGNDEGNDDDRRWAEALEHVRSQVPERTFHFYVKPLEFLGCRGDTVVLRAPDHVASWARENCGPALEGAVALAFGPAALVEVELTETERRRQEREALGLDRQPRPRRRRRAS